MGNLSSKQIHKRHDVIVWDHVAAGMQEQLSQTEQQQLSKTGKKNSDEVGSGFGRNILQFLFNNSSHKNSGKKRSQNKKKAATNKKPRGDSKVVTPDKSSLSLSSILEKKQSNATNVRPRMVKSVQHCHSAKVYPTVQDTRDQDVRPAAARGPSTPHHGHDMDMFLATSVRNIKKFNNTTHIAIHQ